ncbi:MULTISPECIES: nickel/cobalt efflux protein RcnA [Pseudomonas]|jgi:nickel/cobalt transporter (NicO) family protein|uniref:Nickel/cobalt efflux system n=2 Tax=Pseudomonas TaxID=286 RepID=A0A4Y9T9M9_PSEFL|nr:MULTISPECIES: nickel/cobalt efflux protein RcnA [Pseudomonas]CRM93989.1 Nickel/cobalt efflux system RcnA [Pseudomonas sp. 22 E 5]MCX9151548.1 nickel/cobalt efflux protein RcnA [Pseudomonas sp. TB1-B1]QXH69490.1 nickel/cobalt efflux protein RcnA [Pseudomonas asgharzadehiana]TFW40994.1 nickel/cobalt efflux protein RcnA [Pseudomonas fluorescens]TKJ61242.1 nickel/cobalt efflux protein RcnA [Pseudomonas sp. CFBP13506]
MPNFAELLQQGGANAWLYFPSAILLGALHGLEPGHSKTMMAAFIVAIRGSVKQAVLLGLAATLSHTAVVWLVAIGGMYLGKGLDAQTTEPYFQLASAALIIGIALWMLWRTWRGERMFMSEQGAGHSHDPHDETHRIDTGHGRVELAIFEDGVPPRWRLTTLTGHAWGAADVRLMTTRPDGARQSFSFVERDGYLESAIDVPEPHEFSARLSLGHAGHSHDYDLEYQEHDHAHAGLELSTDGYQDAHERAHANDIRKRFTRREVTTGQIVMFGLTGGLIPCPAAITVLLLCLQVKEVALGGMLVLCFSIGLALTLVTVGAAAAVGARQASSRWPWLGTVARRAPYLSSALIIGVGLYVGFHGWIGLNA